MFRVSRIEAIFSYNLILEVTYTFAVYYFNLTFHPSYNVEGTINTGAQEAEVGIIKDHLETGHHKELVRFLNFLNLKNKEMGQK